MIEISRDRDLNWLVLNKITCDLIMDCWLGILVMVLQNNRITTLHRGRERERF